MVEAYGYLARLVPIEIPPRGKTLLEARLYQVSAKRSLENQILVEKDQDENHTGPVINNTATKTGDVLGRMDIPRLGMSVAVLQGTSSRVLRLGIGHIAGTPRGKTLHGITKLCDFSVSVFPLLGFDPDFLQCSAIQGWIWEQSTL